MNHLPESMQQKPSMRQVMIEDLNKVVAWLDHRVGRLFNWALETTQNGGRRRRWLALLLGATLWAAAAYRANPRGAAPFDDILTYPFLALFAAEVMRHVLVAAMAFWIALWVSADFLDDVFELNDQSIAEKYILQAAFASNYNRIEIKDGQVDVNHQKSTIARIGGPGLVKVHYENAALFEKANGEPRVIGPGRTAAVLEQFERLRAVIDLRDQIVDLDVLTRSRDGLHVQATGGQMIYSVARGNQAKTLERPYPFEEDAIKKLVYQQLNQNTNGAKGSTATSERSRREAKSPITEMRTFIQSRLEEFINKSSLSEFLAAVQDQDKEALAKQEETLALEAQALTRTAVRVQSELQQAKTEIAREKKPFIGRDKITARFYDEIRPQAQARGFDLNWIDIGTWVLPDDAISKQHLEAWRLSSKNLSTRNKLTMDELRKASRLDHFADLAQGIILLFEYQRDELDANELINQLTLTYREKLRSALRSYERQDEEPPVNLRAAIKHLENLQAVRDIISKQPDQSTDAAREHPVKTFCEVFTIADEHGWVPDELLSKLSLAYRAQLRSVEKAYQSEAIALPNELIETLAGFQDDLFCESLQAGRQNGWVPDIFIRRIAAVFRVQLQEIYQDYLERGEAPPKALDEALMDLSKIAFHWLQGQ